MFGLCFLPYSLFSFHFSDFCPEANYIFREIFPSQLIRHFWQRVVTNCLMCMQFKGIKTQVLLCINITIAEIETEVVVTYNSWNCVWFKIVLVLELSLAGWRVDGESSLLYMEIVHCTWKSNKLNDLCGIWTVSSRRYNIKRLVLALSPIFNCLKLLF